MATEAGGYTSLPSSNSAGRVANSTTVSSPSSPLSSSNGPVREEREQAPAARLPVVPPQPKPLTPKPGGGAKIMSSAEIAALMAPSKMSPDPKNDSLDFSVLPSAVPKWSWSHSRPKKNEKLAIMFDWNQQRYSLSVPASLTALDVKRLVLSQVSDPSGPLNPANFVLKIDAIDHYLVNENIALHRLPIMSVCTKAYVDPLILLVEKPAQEIVQPDLRAEIKDEWRRNGDIANLIGDSMLVFLSFENEEIDYFRQQMLKRIVEWRAETEKNWMAEAFPEYYNGEPLLPNLPQNFTVTVYTPEKSQVTKKESMAKQLSCVIHDTVNDLRAKAFKKFQLSADRSLTAGKTAEDYWLKVTGKAAFMFGDRKVIDYDYIRVCLSKGRQIELTLVERAPLEASMVKEDYSLSFVERILVQKPEAVSLEPMDFDQQLERPEDKFRPFSIFTVNRPFKVRVSGLENLPALAQGEGPAVVFVMVELYHSGARIAPPIFTLPRPYAAGPRWTEWLTLDYKICNIPKGARLSFSVYKRPSTRDRLNSEPVPTDVTDKDIPIGWINWGLVDHRQVLRSGNESFKIWPNARANPIGTCVENLAGSSAPILFVELEAYIHPIAFPPDAPGLLPHNLPSPAPEWERTISELISTDPLSHLADPTRLADHNKLLWHWRGSLMGKPHSLPKLMLAVPWNDYKAVKEAHVLLSYWKPISAIQALELLDAKFADPAVRDYAVQRLDQLEDHEVEDYLLQLTQVLKYESHHDSSLARFLLRRALRNKKRVGHALFWHLKAEMHVPEIAERYGLLLEAYLRGCGENTRQELLKECDAMRKLLDVANKIKAPMSPQARKELLLAELAKISFPPKFLLPLDPKLEAKGLLLEKCKFMDSKKLPLWLVFSNAEPIGNTISVIFKAGDDLRQDALTLQLIRLMDKLWKKESMDLRLQPYGAISTGDQVGMIEVVLAANTTANINKEASGAMAVFYKDTLTLWLKKHNPSVEWAKAQETFLMSCAGYCVATYVLGIGDRHNDNIMLTQKGHLFHIDFGHFLGNFKSKFGVKRERAPFIFTAQFCHVLGGKKSEMFKQFVRTCAAAYNVLRKHATLFINLFLMMLSTGIPELTKEEDIAYLRDHFSLGLNDKQAGERFEAEIHEALNTKTVVINDVVHILAHR